MALGRLTRTHRRRAGWLIALAYLLCVVAPTLSFALPGSRASAHCLTVSDHSADTTHVHGEGLKRVHHDGHGHHGGAGLQAEPSVAQAVKIAEPNGDFSLVKSSPAEPQHAVDGKCCGLMCVTALPATFAAVTQSPAPKAVRVSDCYRELADNLPAVHYRPPIS